MVRLERRPANLVQDNMVVCERQCAHILETSGENPPET